MLDLIWDEITPMDSDPSLTLWALDLKCDLSLELDNISDAQKEGRVDRYSCIYDENKNLMSVDVEDAAAATHDVTEAAGVGDRGRGQGEGGVGPVPVRGRAATPEL